MSKILIIFIVCLLVLSTGCKSYFMPSKFGHGDEVILRQTGESGKVVGSKSKRNNEYKVRTSSGSKWVKESDLAAKPEEKKPNE